MAKGIRPSYATSDSAIPYFSSAMSTGTVEGFLLLADDAIV